MNVLDMTRVERHAASRGDACACDAGPCGAQGAGHPRPSPPAEFDGIRQADNPAPTWWHITLALAILLGAFYLLVAMVSPVYLSPVERLAARQAEEYERLFASVGTLQPTPGTLLTLMDDPKWEAIASGMFRSNCASCHGASGAGQVGPNLTDDHYKNVAAVGDIYTVIAQGAGGGAMPAWSGSFSQNEMVLLSAYVASLRGSSPPGIARAPEGSRIEAWASAELGGNAPAAAVGP
jgi:cytochrome c oxidase cbb3-type subunit 3